MLLILTFLPILAVAKDGLDPAFQIIDEFNPTLTPRRMHIPSKDGGPGRWVTGTAYYNDKYPVKIIEPDSDLNHSSFVKSIERRPDTLLVANYNHDGQLYLAEIPKRGLKNVYLFSQPFQMKEVDLLGLELKMVLGHAGALLSFDSSSPIRIFPQNDQALSPPTEVFDFVYGAYFVGGATTDDGKRIIEAYNPLQGSMLGSGDYGTTHAIISTSRWLEMETSNARIRKRYKVTVPPVELNLINEAEFSEFNFLSHLIRDADKNNREGVRYDTICRSCLTPIVDAVLKSIDKGAIACRTFNGLIGRISPVRSKLFLQEQGIYSGSTSLQDNPILRRYAQ